MMLLLIFNISFCTLLPKVEEAEAWLASEWTSSNLLEFIELVYYLNTCDSCVTLDHQSSKHQ